MEMKKKKKINKVYCLQLWHLAILEITLITVDNCRWLEVTSEETSTFSKSISQAFCFVDHLVPFVIVHKPATNGHVSWVIPDGFWCIILAFRFLLHGMLFYKWRATHLPLCHSETKEYVRYGKIGTRETYSILVDTFLNTFRLPFASFTTWWTYTEGLLVRDVNRPSLLSGNLIGYAFLSLYGGFGPETVVALVHRATSSRKLTCFEFRRIYVYDNQVGTNQGNIRRRAYSWIGR